VSAERISIQDRISQLADTLRGRRQCSFEELFEGAHATYDIIVTFLAVLEMTKRRMLRIYQADPDAPLHLEYRVLEAHEGEPEFGSDEDYWGSSPAPPSAPAEDDEDEDGSEV